MGRVVGVPVMCDVPAGTDVRDRPLVPPRRLDDAARVAVLQTYRVLDTGAEQEYDDLVMLAATVCGTTQAAISLIDEDRQWFKARVGIEIPQSPRAESFCAYTILDPGRVLQVEDARLDARFVDNPFVTERGLRFYAGTALVGSDDQPLGSLCVLGEAPHRLSPDQVAALEAIGRQVVAQLELRRLLLAAEHSDALLRASEARFRVLAQRDRLTGLADRASFLERMRDVQGGPLVEQPVEVRAGVHVRTGTSAGWLVTDGRVLPDEALRRADQAMYDKKHARRRGPDVVLEVGDSGADLRRGLDAGELRVHYQPFYDVCRSGRGLRGHLSGAEALVRWQHPTRGLLGADQVVPLAEQTGLVGELGSQVLAQAIAQTAQWDRRGLLPPGFRTHVNLAAQQLHTGRVLETVVGHLASNALDPRRLCVEVTESGMLDVEEFTVAAARAISDVGVELALDDFGTGFSSLTQLRTYPFGVVKVDRSFVEGLGASCEDDAIVESVVALALRLGIVPVAEGVETLAQLHRLVDLGCSRVQGFLLGRPVPVDEWDEVVLLAQDLVLGPDQGIGPQQQAGPGCGTRHLGELP